MGGAIFAAPITVPLLVVAARRHPTTPFRWVGALLAGATLAEVAWALTYLVADEAKPWIWLLPLLTSIVAMAALLAASSPRRPLLPHA